MFKFFYLGRDRRQADLWHFLLWGLLLERPAEAYIDPGSGSLLYQALLAGLLGLGFTARRAGASILKIVRSRFGLGGSHDRPGQDHDRPGQDGA
jgi:hypothetical protein